MLFSQITDPNRVLMTPQKKQEQIKGATNVAPAPVMSGNSQRIDKIKDKMSNPLGIQPMTLSNAAFPMERLIPQNKPSLMNVTNQQPGVVPTTQQTIGKAPEQIQEEITQDITTTKKISAAQLRVMMQRVPDRELKLDVIESLLERGYEIETPEQTQTGFDRARGVVDKIPELPNFIKENPVLNMAFNVKDFAGNVISAGEGLASGFDRRGQKAQEAISAGDSGEISRAEGISLGTMQALGVIPDAIGEAFMLGVKQLDDTMGGQGTKILNELGETKVGQMGIEALGQGMEAYNNWATENPNDARRLEALLVPAEIGLDLVGGFSVKQGAKQIAKQSDNAVSRWFKNVAEKGLDKVGDMKLPSPSMPAPMKNIFNKSVESVEGISNAKKQALMNNPYQEIGAEALRKLDGPTPPVDLKDLQLDPLREVMQEVDDAIDTIRTQKGEGGEIYNILRSDPTIRNTNDLIKNIQNEIKDTNLSLDRIIKKVDPENILKSENILKGTATTAQIHDFRKSLDNWITAERNKIIQGKAPAGGLSNTLTKIREHTDNILKSDPNWKQADMEWKALKDDLDMIEEGITYREARKKGQIKDNIDNILLNINKPAKAQLLSRLEQFVPGISQRIEMISSIPELAKAYTTIPKGFNTAIGGGILGATAGREAAVLGAIGGFFGSAGLSTVRRKAIMKALTNMSESGKKSLQTINNAIQEGNTKVLQNNARINLLKNEIKKNIPKGDKELQKAVDNLNTSIFLKSEGPLERGIQGEVFVAGKQGITRGTTGPQGITARRNITELDPQGIPYKQSNFNLDEYVKKQSQEAWDNVKKQGEKVDRRASRVGDETQFGTIEKTGYDGMGSTTREYAIVNGKKYYSTDIGDIYRKGEKFDDMINKSISQKTERISKLDEMDIGIARQSQISYITDAMGKNIDEMTPNEKDIVYRLINNKRLQEYDDMNNSLFQFIKDGGEIDDDMLKGILKEYDDFLSKQNANVTTPVRNMNPSNSQGTQQVPQVTPLKAKMQERVQARANNKLSDNATNDLQTPKKTVQSDTLVSKSDSMKAPNKELQPLYEEARKYKSADEFVSEKVKDEDKGIFFKIRNGLESNGVPYRTQRANYVIKKQGGVYLGYKYDTGELVTKNKSIEGLKKELDGFAFTSNANKGMPYKMDVINQRSFDEAISKHPDTRSKVDNLRKIREEANRK